MKKSLLLFSALLFMSACFAKTRRIKVSNFQFSTPNINAKVGDTIIWVWQSGGHTTTSTSVPSGAKIWDKPINQSQPRYKYILKKAGTYNYRCNFHSQMTGTINVTNALVAGLDDIEISADLAKAVLTWQISSSENVAQFSIQRSTDGTNFKEVAKLKASEMNAYKYADDAVPANKYVYYQVVLTDKKGNTELSDIKMFTNNQDVAKLVTAISPNPVTNPGHLNLQFNADAEGKMQVQLFTQGGRLVKQTEMQANKGLNNGHFHLGDLTPGSYYIICKLGDKTEKHVIVYQ